MNYSDLQTAVITYFKRGDIAARVPSWIELAEAYLFRELSVKSTAINTTGTTTDDIVTLPGDFETLVRITISTNGIEQNLDYVTAPDEYTWTDLQPSFYTIEGDSLRIINSGTGMAYKLYYLPKLGNLSGSITTNWLLANGEDLYLYATALQGAVELKNDGEVAKLTQIVTQLLDSVRRYAERAGQPLSGRLQIKPRRTFNT